MHLPVPFRLNSVLAFEPELTHLSPGHATRSFTELGDSLKAARLATHRVPSYEVRSFVRKRVKV